MLLAVLGTKEHEESAMTDMAVEDDSGQIIVWQDLSRPPERLEGNEPFPVRLRGAVLGFLRLHRTQFRLTELQLGQLAETVSSPALSNWRKEDAPALLWVRLDNGEREGGILFVDRWLADGVRDRTAVVLAGLFVRTDKDVQLLPRQGLRVVAHVSADESEIHITSASVSMVRPKVGDDRARLKAAPAIPAAGQAPKRQVLGRRLSVVAADPVSRFGLAAREACRPPIRRPETVQRILEERSFTLPVEGDQSVLRADGRFDVIESDDTIGMPVAGDPVRAITAAPPPTSALTPDVWAATAYWHTQRLFDMLAGWGFAPSALLRFIKLPIKVRYLAQVNGAQGNAQARWINDQPLYPPSLRPLDLELRYGYATGGGMSLACDPRWQWHEFGHVLLGGTTGHLELPFSHSVGDALSAIHHDPDSALADGGSFERGRTFPWNCTDTENPYVGTYARFHNRCTKDGWAWRGRRILGSIDDTPRRYRAEQVLSSTLFLLYRALGGDRRRQTDGTIDVAARRCAAEHCLYLLVRALALLGPEVLVPAEGPRHLMSALIDADVGTADFGGRAGGSARKVIAWVFEYMGLSPQECQAGVVVDGPGSPPAVDLYIDDGRGGLYTPFDFRDPKWRTPGAAVKATRTLVEGELQLVVTVGNRGYRPSSEGHLSVWMAVLPSGGAPGSVPDWGDPGWAEQQREPLPSVSNGGSVRLELKLLVPATSVALLIGVGCPEDRTNIDPELGLPCARGKQALDHLVAWDNNLACVIV